MEKTLFEKIEEQLGELLSIMPEKDYMKFIQDDEIMIIYDKVASLENPEGILTDAILSKILDLVIAKKELYK